MPGLKHQSGTREPLISGGLLIAAILAYGFWLTNGSFDFLLPSVNTLGLTFNSMLDHMLRGEFDVDPSIVGLEGFLRPGHVYAYWGPFLAAIRLPLILIPDGLQINVTRLSCWVAVSIAATAKWRTLRLAFSQSPRSALRDSLYWCLLVALLFSGAQVEFLSASLYQEVCLWAGAIAAVFVYLAVRGLVIDRFSGTSLGVMALLAGVALLTRVSTGVGLYLALCASLLVAALRDGRSWPRLVAPMLILAAFAGAAGFVNYQRWGNPAVFADYQYYLYNNLYPDLWPRAVAYGLFNPSRIPLGVIYYFFPVWVLHRADGSLLFQEAQRRLLDSTELPPSSFLLTDALLLLLAAHAVWQLRNARGCAGLDRSRVLTVATGLAVPCILMLCAIGMCFRYRIEFYPLIEFGAFLGFTLLCRRGVQPATLRRWRIAPALATAIGVAGSHLALILYKMHPTGPSVDFVQPGIVALYLQEFQRHFPRLAAVFL